MLAQRSYGDPAQRIHLTRRNSRGMGSTLSNCCTAFSDRESSRSRWFRTKIPIWLWVDGEDGKLGTIRLARPYGPFGATVFAGKDKVIQSDPKLVQVDYKPMLEHVLEFFRTGKSPVPETETLELFAFMDAAQHSKEHGGAPAKLR